MPQIDIQNLYTMQTTWNCGDFTFNSSRYYSPGYSEKLLERVEQYQPVV